MQKHSEVQHVRVASCSPTLERRLSRILLDCTLETCRREQGRRAYVQCTSHCSEMHIISDFKLVIKENCAQKCSKYKSLS